ncbi:tryptophan 2,3-dioxygenase [Sphaerimonospora thailandensis]|uniref:Tryptophan 2,3-dioxygenase n=1 Tax=Sphaerimonospora thailandensis TaxID=795644 RepID=A0A8J3R7W6_9ACTN|nr:tryptophan 2,3-dioxygenase family protein [Sphaerimonospora thailandensis]GIH69674.1 tryptophan 2,3-dioxygenase [Sphaerimonospora thailandensis]
MTGSPNPAPRLIERSSDEARSATVARTGGTPLLELPGGSTPYIDYESIDVLLNLQQTRSGTHDEMAFYIMGQVKELLFKLMRHELLAAQRHIRADHLPGAFEAFRRVVRIQELLVSTWDVLGTLTPAQFNAFRDHLGTASGFQSYMYRHLEFLLGNKVRALLNPHRGVAGVYQELEEALHAPSLYDDVIGLLAARGHKVDAEALDRDWSQAYAANDSVEQAWFEVYGDPTPGNDLYQLGEALMDIADRFQQWRYRHLITVERIIGYKPGTGGTSGSGWLRKIVEHQFFPELWAVRTRL